jgi:hypothetical protein
MNEQELYTTVLTTNGDKYNILTINNSILLLNIFDKYFTIY